MITMKNLTSFLAGIGLLLATVATVPFVIGQEPHKSDPAEDRQRLMKLSNTELLDVVRVAFEQRDVDTLIAGVESEVTSAYFVHEYNASKDNDLKALLALRMLRSDTICKPFPPLAILRGGEGSDRYILMGMILPLITERLGDVIPVQELVMNAKLRLRVADRFEASIKGLPPKNLEPRPSKKSLHTEPASSTEISGAKIPPLIAAATDSRLSPTSTWPWFVGVLAILLAGVLALKRRAS